MGGGEYLAPSATWGAAPFSRLGSPRPSPAPSPPPQGGAPLGSGSQGEPDPVGVEEVGKLVWLLRQLPDDECQGCK